MKKGIKIISFVVGILFVSIFFVKVFANTKPEVKEYINNNHYTAVLYSNDELYFWGGYFAHCADSTRKVILEGIKDIENHKEEYLAFIDNDNNFKMILADADSRYLPEVCSQVTRTLKENVKKITGNNILTINNELYSYNYTENMDNFDEKLIMEDVKDWSYYNNSYLILDNDNKLYAYGANIFGKKINDGEDITDSPIMIAENVKEFSCEQYNENRNVYGNFYLTNDNKLYIMSYDFAYPKLLKENVNKFLYNEYYIKDGKTYYIDYYIDDDCINIREDKLLFNEELDSIDKESGFRKIYYLTKKDSLYDSNLNKIYDDVKQINVENYNDNLLILSNNGELSIVKYTEKYNYNTYNYERLYQKNKMLLNVKQIININTFVMNDGTIYVKGNGEYDIGDFNGTGSSNYKNYVVIKGLPNVDGEITVSQINLNYNNKTNFVVGDTYDYYADIYPYNAIDKDIIWESDDNNIATVDNKGTIKIVSPGKTKIRVKSTTLDVYDEVEITVHPKNSGIEILGDKEIKVNKYSKNLLKIKVNPEGVMEQKIKWSSTPSGWDESTDEEIISFYGINEVNYLCYDDVCPNSYDEILFIARKAGTYTITATTEDGLYSDSITVIVEQEVTSLGLEPDRNNLLGATLYIYMSESNYLDLNVKVYPEDATNKEVVYTSSDESIATVDNTGRVMAKRSGKVTITYKAKNYDVENKINVLIFGKDVSTKIGDVDGDGIVDILDLVKLRRHVAGVEAIQ